MSRRKGGVTSSTSAPANALGETIRRRRAVLQLSLGDLAAMSGVSAAMLSSVERGTKSPTIRVLSHIAEALACSISDLLAEPTPARVRVSRAASRKRVTDPESGIERVSFAGIAGVPDVDVVVYRIPAGADTGSFAPHRPGVVEHVVAVRGAVEVQVGETVVDLRPDDWATYEADATHRYVNRGALPAELLLIIDSSQAAARVANGG